MDVITKTEMSGRAAAGSATIRVSDRLIVKIVGGGSGFYVYDSRQAPTAITYWQPSSASPAFVVVAPNGLAPESATNAC